MFIQMLCLHLNRAHLTQISYHLRVNCGSNALPISINLPAEARYNTDDLPINTVACLQHKHGNPSTIYLVGPHPAKPRLASELALTQTNSNALVVYFDTERSQPVVGHVRFASSSPQEDAALIWGLYPQRHTLSLATLNPKQITVLEQAQGEARLVLLRRFLGVAP